MLVEKENFEMRALMSWLPRHAGFEKLNADRSQSHARAKEK